MKRRTTQDIVIDYIRTSATDGVLNKSLMDIAEQLGYSNATIHRVLKALKEENLIAIVPGESPRHPNTIIYQGAKQEAEDILVQGNRLLQRLHELTEDVENYVAETSRILRYIEQQKDTKK